MKGAGKCGLFDCAASDEKERVLVGIQNKLAGERPIDETTTERRK